MTGIFKSVAKAARKRREYKATVSMLKTMSERQLDDIGISDGDARRAARVAIYHG